MEVTFSGLAARVTQHDGDLFHGQRLGELGGEGGLEVAQAVE